MLGVGRNGPRLGPSSAPLAGPEPSGASSTTDRPNAGALAGAIGATDRPNAGALAGAIGAGKATDRGPDEREAWAVLASVSGLGPVTLGALVAWAGSAGVVVAMGGAPDGHGWLSETLAAAVEAIEPDPDATRPAAPGSSGGHRVHPSHALVTRIVEAILDRATLLGRIRDLGLTILTLDDPAYPRRLRAIEMPPPVLYVRGDPAALDLAHAVAIVGTRRPSDAGRRIASRVAGAIGRQGAAVVSGLAVGIDGAAHAAALTEAAVTVAVLGGGHGRVYPRAHVRLADAIVAAGGAVVAELPPDTLPMPGTFPRRNRLISGLADATVVVEAGARSGALITASWALEQGRGCFIVPGSIDAPASVGCLAFLREWAGEARIVAGVGELLEDLGLADVDASPPARGRPTPASTAPTAGTAGLLAELGSAEGTVAAALAAGRATVDDLVAATMLPVATVLGTLTLLEMRGLTTGAYGRYLPAGRLATTSLADRSGRSVGMTRDHPLVPESGDASVAGPTPPIARTPASGPTEVAPSAEGVLP